jgi:hypothetical protein
VGIYREEENAVVDAGVVAGNHRESSIATTGEGGESMVATGCGEDDLRRAEAVLHELALVLLRVPVDEHTRDLHLRVLRLKRDIARWHSRMPDESARRTVINELARLQQEVAIWDRGAAGTQASSRSETSTWPRRRRRSSQGDGTT